MPSSAVALAHPNIAFIKYWGNREETLRLPANGSISMNLAALWTRVTVEWEEREGEDHLIINGEATGGATLQRVSAFLDLIRQQSGLNARANMLSESNFPSGAGLASSASAFAALTLAATRAAGLELDSIALSRLARRGSGSACRSVPSGFVEWYAGASDADSYAVSIAPPEHWALVDLIAIVSAEHKAVGSLQGHALAPSSPLQAARLADAPRRLDLCRRAILTRDFEALAAVAELDSDMMHAVMMTSAPPLLYWQPATIAVMQTVRGARARGIAVCYTIDAGPNVHILCPESERSAVRALLEGLEGVQEVVESGPGEGARLL